MHLPLYWRTVWLVVASLLAGALNAMAGGGSFLSFPALLGVGVLPVQANATNTVALWPGQFTSIAAYWEDLKHNFRLLLPLCTAAVIGGMVGGVVLLHTGQGTFLHLVPWLLLVAALLFAVSTPVSRWLQRRALDRNAHKIGGEAQVVSPSWILLFGGTVLVSFYIGYFGAGAGFLMMSLLAIAGIDNINQVNALKVCTTTLANGMAVVIFVAEKQVVWQHCVLMMLTAAVGGYMGGRYSRRLNPRLMRSLVVAIGLGMAAYFFWKQA
jgi:uncharacterized protein